MLAQSSDKDRAFKIFDTGGTATGAAQAARAASKDGATVILGPLLSAEVAAVIAAVGLAIPVIAFSNDAALRESGAFVLGITARQRVSAILDYAAGRGVRRVGVGGDDSGWAAQVRVAAEIEGPAHGITVTTLPIGMLDAAPQAMADTDDGLPDAVLMPDPIGLTQMAPQLAVHGIQPLGAFTELDLTQDQVRQLDGTWLAAPDPAGFSDFSRAFEQRMGTRPGIIAALAFDAANMVERMRLGGGTDRSAVLASNGYDGVCGHIRFRDDGSASRTLAILHLTGGGLRKISAAAAA